MLQGSRNDFIVPICKENLTVLWHDDSCIVINKPSGLLSVPGKHPSNHDSAVSRLTEQFSDAQIAHRLDMDTSGLMVLARGKTALRHLNQQFASRQIKKEYTAVVYGQLNHEKGEIAFPLICDWPNRPKQKVDFKQGKAAQTYYQVLERVSNKNQTRLKLKPFTGRSHQLRVHLAEIGHPICGCNFYAHSDAKKQSQRLLLHACALSFTHPTTGKKIEFKNAAPF